MPSFSTLFIVAIGTLATLTAAAPLDVPTAIGDAAVGPVTGAIADNIIGERTDGIPSLSTILADTKSRISSISENLNSTIAKNGMNHQVLMGTVNNIWTVLQDALANAKKLSAGSLPDTDPSARVISQLSAEIPSIILGIINILSDDSGPGTDLSSINPLFTGIGALMAELFTNVSGITSAVPAPSSPPTTPSIAWVPLGSLLFGGLT